MVTIFQELHLKMVYSFLNVPTLITHFNAMSFDVGFNSIFLLLNQSSNQKSIEYGMYTRKCMEMLKYLATMPAKYNSKIASTETDSYN